MKRTVPMLITLGVGFILIVHYFVPRLGDLAAIATVHFNILAAIAFILGGGNLLRMHGEKVIRQSSGWGYSLVTVVAFLVTLGVGMFKVGVSPRPGLSALLEGPAPSVGFATLDASGAKHVLRIVVRKATPETRYPVLLNGAVIGEIQTDAAGAGSFRLEPTADGGQAARPAASAPEVLAAAAAGQSLRIGELLRGELVGYSWLTGDYAQNGSPFWFLYEYVFQPLVQTTFAMLAFYIASAAFRAFRARNVESVLLLGTAFLILLGRTFVGTAITSPLPEEGFWSFFQIPHLTSWIMSVFATAGTRAIMIGVALGVVSTSIRVLLGMDRSYLGAERG